MRIALKRTSADDEPRGHTWERLNKCSECGGALRATRDQHYHASTKRHPFGEAVCCRCCGHVVDPNAVAEPPSAFSVKPLELPPMKEKRRRLTPDERRERRRQWSKDYRDRKRARFEQTRIEQY